MQSSKILVVEDCGEFRRFICSVLQQRVEFQVLEAADGLEALQKAEELQPDVILLDIGLPSLNGLEVAKRVRKVAPATKILFISLESDPAVVKEALTQGEGYIHKPRSQNDLLLGIDAVLRRERFVSRNLGIHGRTVSAHRHELLFCSDDEAILEGLTHFIAAALLAGNPAIVWATESHRASLFQRLRTHGVDIGAAIRSGTYVASDVEEVADESHILATLQGLTEAASKAGKKHPRVAVCGERTGRFWGEGKTDEAMLLEELWNDLAKNHDMDILCVYPEPQGQTAALAFKSIREAHTGVYSH